MTWRTIDCYPEGIYVLDFIIGVLLHVTQGSHVTHADHRDSVSHVVTAYEVDGSVRTANPCHFPYYVWEKSAQV
jgi:hypothetical protein